MSQHLHCECEHFVHELFNYAKTTRNSHNKVDFHLTIIFPDNTLTLLLPVIYRFAHLTTRQTSESRLDKNSTQVLATVLQITISYYRLLQVTTIYYRLLQFTTFYYRLLQVLQFTSDYHMLQITML